MSFVVLFFPMDHGHEIIDDGTLRITSLSNYIQMQESERHGTDVLLAYQGDNSFLKLMSTSRVRSSCTLMAFLLPKAVENLKIWSIL